MLITTCPQCRAKFRVTEQHLSAADGLVVCSRCRGIFQAKDSLQRTSAAKPKAPERPAVKLSAHLFGSTIRSGRKSANEFDLGDLSEPPAPSAHATAAAETPVTDEASAPSDASAKQTAPEQAKTSWFARIFSKKNTAPALDAATEAAETVASAQPETAPPAAKPAEPIEPAEPAAATPAEAAQEEFSAVPEPQSEPVALLEDQSNGQQNHLPGAHLGEMPAPYDPRFDPRFYPPPPTREEMNWTMASIVALIVLVIQLFYIILQK
ncbi:MAG: zinc-ribbon domain-containing protein [Neisseria sp.]|nr:zinc-ribbon domain-containing protein [Neisseria sp.]